MTVTVTELGYLGIGASDLPAWRSFATEVLGLAAADHGGGLLLRLDAAPWRLHIEPSAADDIAYAGFQVASTDALATLGERLEQMGVRVTTADAAVRRQRGAAALLQCEDPDGLRIELYCGRADSPEPFVSPRQLGFVTGDQGLGHMVLMVKDAEASKRFYVDGLGFRVSDYITLGKPPRALELTFLHCNPRHHTVALAPAPGAPKRLNHLMIQVDSLDAVGTTLDLIHDRNLPLSNTLGRHTNDHMLSFYARTPSGFDLEFGFGARTIDDADWEVRHYDSGSRWGHRRPAAAATR